MQHTTTSAGGVRWLCVGAALLLGLATSCTEKQPPANIPTTVDGNDPRPHLVTIAFQNRGEGPTTAHYTYNGRKMGTYSEGLRNVVRELRSAEEPYVLILHEPGYSIADAGGNVDGLNARFALALAGKHVLQYGLDTDADVLAAYIAVTHDQRGVYEVNGRRVSDRELLNGIAKHLYDDGIIVTVEQGSYRMGDFDGRKPVRSVVASIVDHQNGHPGFVRWLSLQDSVEWEGE